MGSSQTALVTGATGAIGRAIVRRIATESDYRVVLVCRDRGRAQEAVEDIRAAGGRDVDFVLADLARPRQVMELGRNWSGPVRLLVNNAAVTSLRRQETPEGVEEQFATNVLGYFWMIQAFAPHLVTGARVVNVASYWAGGLDLDDLEFHRRHYDNDRAYRQSKQADRMLSKAFAERLRDGGIAVNACHPGDVHSTLSHNLGFGGSQTPAEGADTPVWLGLSAEAEGLSGAYFECRRPVRCAFGSDREGVKALFQHCMERGLGLGLEGLPVR